MFTEGVAVMTLNGLITIGDLPPKEWASQTDQKRFQKKIDEYHDGAIIVGSGTVGKDPQWYVDRALQGGPKRVVLTSRPEEYEVFQYPGKIEFLNLTPENVLKSLEAEGRKKALVLAGEKVMGAFLEADLIDRLSITLEPIAAGHGKSLATGNFIRRFELVSHQVNIQSPSTLFLCYDRIRN